MRAKIAAACLLCLVLAACGRPAGNRPEKQPSERERDSLLGASGVPGSAVVQKALQASDTAAAQAQGQDSIAR